MLGCNNATGNTNITRSISARLPNIYVTGGYGFQLGFENHWLWGNSLQTLGHRRTYLNGTLYSQH